MAKKKNRSVGFSANTAYRLVRLFALLAPGARIALLATSNEDKLRRGLKAYTGFNLSDGSFSWQNLAEGWMPSVGAAVATYGVPKIGGFIRRALKF